MNTAKSVKYAGRDYVIEMAIAALLYVGILYVRPYLVTHAGNPSLGDVIKLLPLAPLWLMFWSVWRHYRRIDEYEQKRFLETLAISFGVSAMVLVTYQFLTDVGAPQLDMTWVFPVLGVTWALVSVVRGPGHC